MDFDENLAILSKKAWDLVDKISGEIQSDQSISFYRHCSEHGVYCGVAETPLMVEEERERLIAIRDSLKDVETMLVFLQTKLQAQAVGVPYHGQCRTACFETNTMLPAMRCYPSCTRAVIGSESTCDPDCSRYKGTFDVFYKVTHQEGFARLWRGTYASLALAVPTVGIYLPCYDIFRNFLDEFTSRNAPSMTPYVPLVAGSVARSLACITCYPVELARTRMQAFKETQIGVKPPGVLKTLVGVISPVRSTNNLQTSVHNYRFLWTGLGSQIARDVPFSAICWSTLEPLRRRILGMVGDQATIATVFGANFSSGFVAGTLAAAATCPLDVAKTRRQIEKDPSRALKMTTKQTLVEIWRDGGIKGLFTGVGPRVSRVGPSVGIVACFYEAVKYALGHRSPPRDQEDLHHTRASD